MAADELEIVNQALRHLGESRMLTSGDGTAADIVETDTPQGRGAIAFYVEARREVLRAYPWPFARKYALLALASDGTGELWEDEWDFAYTYPVDCLQILRFITVRGANDAFPPRYDIGSFDDVKVIFTDVIEDEAKVLYIEDVEDPLRFPPILDTALAWCLASKLSMLLGTDPKLRDWCLQQYLIAVSLAQRIEGNEGGPHPTWRDESSYTRSRFI